MADDFYYAYVTVADSRQKTSTMQVRISELDAATYISTPQATRDATNVGGLINAMEGLSDGVRVKDGVRLDSKVLNPAYPDPNDDIYAFDKLAVTYQVSTHKYVMTIPCRSRANFTTSNGVDVLIDPAVATPEVTEFITQLVDHGQGGPTGATIDKVLGIRVVA